MPRGQQNNAAPMPNAVTREAEKDWNVRYVP
jgi:hypothetical protein